MRKYNIKQARGYIPVVSYINYSTGLYTFSPLYLDKAGELEFETNLNLNLTHRTHLMLSAHWLLTIVDKLLQLSQLEFELLSISSNIFYIPLPTNLFNRQDY